MEIKKADRLTDLPWVNMFEVEYTDKNGRTRQWQLASRHEQPKCVTGRYQAPDAVIIVPFHTAEQKVVVTREYRVPLADFEYGFPAGLVEKGEAIEETARRELKEETGLSLTGVIKTSPPIYSSAGMTDESVTLVYVECEGRPSAAGATGSEVIDVTLISPSEAQQLCDNSELKFDAKAWLVLSEFARDGRL